MFFLLMFLFHSQQGELAWLPIPDDRLPIPDGKFFYTQTVPRDWEVLRKLRIPKQTKLPTVLTIAEVDQLIDTVLLPVQDLPVQRRLGLHLQRRVDRRDLLDLAAVEMGDERGERIVLPLAAIEDQVVRDLSLRLGDLGVRRDVRRVDDRRVETGRHAVVQKHRVEHRARSDSGRGSFSEP